MWSPHAEAGPTIGKDVEIAKFGVGRYETNLLPKPPNGYTQVFGEALYDAVKLIQKREGIKQTGNIGQATWEVIWNYLDAYRRWQYRNWEVPPPPPPPVPPLVFPFPITGGGYVCQGIHYTSGLPGNVAMDFCDVPNDPILCVEGGVIQKLSGHDPRDDVWDTQGVYGWSTYVRTADGYVYFYTHFGRRAALMVGQRVHTGEIIGWVGDQRFRPDHTHIGVTSPLGISDATKRIAAVSQAPRVAPTA